MDVSRTATEVVITISRDSMGDAVSAAFLVLVIWVGFHLVCGFFAWMRGDL